ncbi:MAG: uracil-DNA glycosylase [Acidimicrobiales bacterium]|nr:uracil-DNA glycosylase [Acidimicrobiales bacterium]
MSNSLELLAVEAGSCTMCGLSDGRNSVVFGSGDPDADLMFVGEGPGAEEDHHGVPFVGRSGRLLDRLLDEELGIDRSACYITNVVKCRPPENRDPRPDEIAACRPYLGGQIRAVDPAVVVTLGNFSSRLLLETSTGITKLRGSSYPFDGRQLVPTFHPAAALRGGEDVMACMRSDLLRAKELMVRV